MSDSACHSIFYGRVMLAPMVRICNLGFRVLCEEYGADLVFSEEIVAAKLCQCRREVRTYPSLEETDIVEYAVYDRFKKAFKRSVVFSTLIRRGESLKMGNGGRVSAPIVLQLGASDGMMAARAVALCYRDIDAVDINMGCPKKFSTDNGFGAALMDKTAIAGDILSQIYAIVQEKKTEGEKSRQSGGDYHFPISFKTRLKGMDPSMTVIMLKEILKASDHTPKHPIVHAITIHARLREQRSEVPPLYDVAAQVVSQCRSDPYFGGICFVLNGSIQSRTDGIEKISRYGFDACMIARAALLDMTCFSPTCAHPERQGHIDNKCQPEEAHHMKILKEMLLSAIRYRTPFKNFKYHLTRVFPEVEVLKPKMPIVQERLRCYRDCCDFLQLTPEELEVVKICETKVELVDSPPEEVSTLLLLSDEPFEDSQKYLREKVDLEDRANQVRRLC